MEDAQGYYTGSTYTKGVYPNYDPRLISVAGRLCGQECIDPSQPFTYADFGCGYGMTLLLLARILPQGQFFGIDAIGEHVSEARRMAKVLGVENVTFLHARFGDLSAGALPQLDFAVAHGVFSWIGPEMRRDLRQLVARHLSPNGIFAASYNLQAGWAHVVPFRNLLLSAVDHGVRDEDAIKAIQRLMEHRAKQEGTDPDILMRGFANPSVDYQRHEFMGTHWELFTNQSMAREMAADGLGFACLYQSRTACHESDTRPIPITSPMFWEDFQAAGLNQSFRTSFFIPNGGNVAPISPPKTAPDVHIGLFPAADLKNTPLMQRLFGATSPFPAIPASRINDRAIETEYQRRLSLHLTSGKGYACKVPISPGGQVSAFRMAEETTEMLAKLREIGAPQGALILPSSQVFTQLPIGMAGVLQHCHDVDEAQLSRKLQDVVKLCGLPENGEQALRMRWQDHFGPWLAGLGAVEPI